MDGFVLLSTAIAIAVPLGFLLIVGIIFFVGRSRPEQGLGMRAGAGGTAPAPAPVEGAWNVQVLGDGMLGALGGALGSAFGIVRVTDGVVAFELEGAAPWQVPCQQVSAQKQGLFSLNGADVTLWTPQGEVRCTVSREHINRFSRNDLKAMRERGYADELLHVLAVNGARVV